MAEQEFARFNVAVDDQTLRLVQEVVESSSSIADHMERAGTANQQIVDFSRNITTSQRDILQQLITYSAISNQIVESTRALEGVNRSLLDLNKQLTAEKKKQTNESEKQRDMDQKRTRQIASDVTGAVLSPLRTAGRLFEKFMPAGVAGGALMVGGALAMRGSQYVTGLREITRTGGMGMMEGMGGLGEAAGLQASMIAASTQIPFFKERYGTEQELQRGAGTMFGLGGIRGGGLVQIMEELPKRAYEAGVGFENAAKMITRLNRVMEQTPDQLLEGFDTIVASAKRAGEKIAEFAERVTKATERTAAYGGRSEEAAKFLEKFNYLIQKHRISEEELLAVYVSGKQVRMSYNEIVARMGETASETELYMIKAADATKTRTEIERAILPHMEDSREAQVEVTDQVKGFAARVSEGNRDLSNLTKNIEELTSVFGMSVKEGIVFVDQLEEESRTRGYSGKKAVDAGMLFSRTLLSITHDQKRSYEMGSEITIALIDNFKDLSLNASDVNNLLVTMVEKFQMSHVEVVANAKAMADLSKAIDVPAKSLIQWRAQMAEPMREMFDEPAKAWRNAGIAMNAMAGMFASGQATVGDYTKIVRTQMDVMEQEGGEAVGHFKTLATVVAGTNIRMSELSRYSEQLSKVNRQYGYDQQASNALLMLFNQGLRTGAAGLSDIRVMMRGPAGAAPGVQALVMEEVIGQGGLLGQMFSEAGVLGGMEMIGDVMRFSGGQGRDARPTGALTRAAGGEGALAGLGREAMGDQMRSAMTSVINRVVGTGANEYQRLSIFRRLGREMFGEEITAYGHELQTMYKMVTSGKEISMDDLKRVFPEMGGDTVKDYTKRTSTAVETLEGSFKDFKKRYFGWKDKENVLARAREKAGWETIGPTSSWREQKLFPGVVGKITIRDVLARAVGWGGY